MGRYALLLISDKEISVAVSTSKEVVDGRIGRFGLREDEEVAETVSLKTKRAVPKILEGFLSEDGELEQRVIRDEWRQKNTTDEISIVRYPMKFFLYVNKAFGFYFKKEA